MIPSLLTLALTNPQDDYLAYCSLPAERVDLGLLVEGEAVVTDLVQLVVAAHVLKIRPKLVI
jgi:hypothetical protein